MDALTEVREVALALVLIVIHTLHAMVRFVVPARFRCKDVTGQIVLITGSGSGIGRLLAQRFARLGCTLVLWDINADGNAETADLCEKYGHPVHQYTCDLSKRQEIYRIGNLVKQDIGSVDILVNNAGIVTGKKFLESDDRLVELTMDVNINAHFWTVKTFLPEMIARNHGHIVTIASMAGHSGTACLGDYCASKFAAVGFDECLRIEMESLGLDGIHTTCVNPSYINTGMFDGAEMKWSWVAPVLEPDYVVDKIMEGILTNQHVLMLPHFMYLTPFLKALLPTKALLVLMKLSGGMNSMAKFTGHKKTH